MRGKVLGFTTMCTCFILLVNCLFRLGILNKINIVKLLFNAISLSNLKITELDKYQK